MWCHAQHTHSAPIVPCRLPPGVRSSRHPAHATTWPTSASQPAACCHPQPDAQGYPTARRCPQSSRTHSGPCGHHPPPPTPRKPSQTSPSLPSQHHPNAGAAVACEHRRWWRRCRAVGHSRRATARRRQRVWRVHRPQYAHWCPAWIAAPQAAAKGKHRITAVSCNATGRRGGNPFLSLPAGHGHGLQRHPWPTTWQLLP